MAKLSNGRINIDSADYLTIRQLNDWGFLKEGYERKDIVSWSINGKVTHEIRLKTNMRNYSPYVILSYVYQGEQRRYKIDLVKQSSNLGKGYHWYFYCPQTNKRCRKLICIDGWFLHRTAFQGHIYKCQSKTKITRKIEAAYGDYFDSKEIYEAMNKKHLKKTYKGVLTKKYTRLLEREKRSKSHSAQEIAHLFAHGI